ncbi:MAG: hypothetical protein AAFZ38_12705, partial [Myxococcota bacterium]
GRRKTHSHVPAVEGCLQDLQEATRHVELSSWLSDNKGHLIIESLDYQRRVSEVMALYAEDLKDWELQRPVHSHAPSTARARL